MHPEKKTHPHCMVAGADGQTATDDFKLKDEEAGQRWLFLNAEQMQAVGNNATAQR